LKAKLPTIGVDYEKFGYNIPANQAMRPQLVSGKNAKTPNASGGTKYTIK
jgi:hypothetical protein